MKVLILDDETPRAIEWRESISANFDIEVDVFLPEEVSELISNLHKARFESRTEEFKRVDGLDAYDLVILDYDLLGLQVDRLSAWATGAELAYCMRLVSSIGPIVVVNQYGTNSFDLTMRRGISSYADVDVGSVQIARPELWRGVVSNGFRPWHWPELLGEPVRFSLMKEFVESHLNSSIIETLGFDLSDSEADNFISYEVAAFIGASQNKAVTFREVVTSEAGLRVFNILEKDRPIVEKMPAQQLAILSTAIVLHWLEKVVLSCQETIADLPHLCAQLPWVVGNAGDIDEWNSLCSINAVKVPEKLQAYRFEPEFFFSRPVFWANKARNEIFASDDFSFELLPEIQFCENLSRFLPEEDCTGFPSDVLAFDKKRWISNESAIVTGVNYEPQSYLLM